MTTNPPDTVVHAILDAMPYTTDGHAIDFDGNLYEAAPLAAKYAATVLRWAADSTHLDQDGGCGCARRLEDLADQLDRPEEPTP